MTGLCLNKYEQELKDLEIWIYSGNFYSIRSANWKSNNKDNFKERLDLWSNLVSKEKESKGKEERIHDEVSKEIAGYLSCDNEDKC